LPDDRDTFDHVLAQIERQTFPDVELLVVARDKEADSDLERHAAHPLVRPLVWTNRDLEYASQDLCFVSGELLLEMRAGAELEDDLVTSMVGHLNRYPEDDAVGADGRSLVEVDTDAPVRLSRNPRWGACPGTDQRRVVVMDAAVREAYEAEESKRIEGHELADIGSDSTADVVLRIAGGSPDEDGAATVGVVFGAEPDAPYKYRHELHSSRHVALTPHRETAARLRLLAPRTVFAPTLSQTIRRVLGHVRTVPREVGDTPALHPFVTNAKPCRLAIQVDDFREGGMETVIMDLAEALKLDNFDPCLLILGETGPAADEARRRGLEMHRMTPSAATYASFLAEQNIELVNAHYSTFGADLCGRAEIPFVQSVHNMYMWFGPPEADRFQDADANTRAYICVSKNVARYSDVKLRLSPAKMIVIPNGCDTGHMDSVDNRQSADALRTELGLSADARIFLSAASIHAVKAQDLLVRSLHRIANECPDAHLILLGRPLDDDYYTKLQSTIRDLDLQDRVHLVGHRRDVPAFYAAADALVMPSFFEGWSLAITEAVLAGLPVIATDVGGASDQLRGTTGIVVSPEVDDLASIDGARLAEMLRAPCDGVRDRIADAMREVYARNGQRSPLPEQWESLTRECAYARYVHVFRWLITGGAAATSTYWTEPLLDLAFAARDA